MHAHTHTHKRQATHIYHQCMHYQSSSTHTYHHHRPAHDLRHAAVTLFTLVVSDNLLIQMFNASSSGKGPEWYRYLLMTVALSCWGMYQGVWNTVLETIYADSVGTGNRSVHT
jgi:hypothetical protein